MKKIIIRGLIGLISGLALSYSITIILSLIINNGQYYYAAPSFISKFNCEITAVLIQAILSGILGFGFGISSVIWENEKLSLVSQTALHFIISLTLILTIGYYCSWFSQSFGKFLIFIFIFISIYFIIWVTAYFSYKKKIKLINRSLK